MTRSTSVKAFRQIEAEGLLSKMRFAVYSALFEHGPATALELYTKCFKTRYRDHSITPRFSELEKIGCVYEVKKTFCTVSGRNAIQWDVTDRLPMKFERLKKLKCKACDGKGFLIEQQARFDL